MCQADDMLRRMLVRGDRVAVQRGRLLIDPVSGRPVPTEWLKEWRKALIASAARLVGEDALEYLSYSVGQYGRHKAGGVTLLFRSLLDEREWHVIFNAHVTRARSSKAGRKGERLPKGQFRVTDRHEFARFWKSTEQDVRRWSGLHQYMGNLRKSVFVGSPSAGKQGRLDAKKVKPLEISHEVLCRLSVGLTSSNWQTASKQDAASTHTAVTDKEAAVPQGSCGSELDSDACVKKHDTKVIRLEGDKDQYSSPEEQSVDEWIADFDRENGFGRLG